MNYGQLNSGRLMHLESTTTALRMWNAVHKNMTSVCPEEISLTVQA
jgi:hypothetical protein